MGVRCAYDPVAMEEAGRPRCHRLRSLRVVGGFLGGQIIEFASGLNCIIGVRGTGKTTILEFIRYAMDAVRDADQRRVQTLITANLKGGRLDLAVETKDGLAYTIRRTDKGEPTVLNDAGKPTAISMKSGGLFRPEFVGQKEFEILAENHGLQQDLLDRFAPREVAVAQDAIHKAESDLNANAIALVRGLQRLEELEHQLLELPDIEEKIQGLVQKGQDAQQINQAHEARAARDREQRCLEQVRQGLVNLANDFKPHVGGLKEHAVAWIPAELRKGPNSAVIDEVQDEIRARARTIDQHLTEILKNLEQAGDFITDKFKRLRDLHLAQEDAFRAVIESQREALEKADDRTRLEKRMNELKAVQQERAQTLKTVSKLEKERASLIEQLARARDLLHKARQAVVDAIAPKIEKSGVRLSIERHSDDERYRRLLHEALSNGVLKSIKSTVDRLAEHLTPMQLTEAIQAGDPQALAAKADLTRDQATKVHATLLGSEALFQIQVTPLDDRPRLQLCDHGVWKDSPQISTGQKGNVVLPLVLLDSDVPLLIDEPETSLDNYFTSTHTIADILQIKANRQLIVITHNPSIPILAHADRVIILESHGTHAEVFDQRELEGCRDPVLHIMDGGPEAFDARRTFYMR